MILHFNAKKWRNCVVNKAFVRIESVEITNFKNVGYGFLDFENNRKNFKANVLGLYGQNGSGKTTLIDALLLLKLAISGKTIPANFADYVHVDASFATLKFNFRVMVKEAKAKYHVSYEFSIRKDIDESLQNTSQNDEIYEKYKTTIFNEVLSYSYENGEEKIRKSALVDTRTNEVFLPESKYKDLVGVEKNKKADLLTAKLLASITSRSFVFSPELLNNIRKSCQTQRHLDLYEALVWFGNYELFIINTTNSGLISLNALPLSFKYNENGKAAIGSLMIKLNEPSSIPKDAFDIVKNVIANMNVVLMQLVPGLTISVKELGTELSKNNVANVRIQLVSHKNSKEIPLQYESEGIKKIISILQLLIVIYNKDSITVAIDELDSGIFEYLLGELLRIISEKGKGQLIFTSHNLRPLETLNKDFIAFTTTNPDNRYIRLKDIKTNNNLRDFYYRDIVLGEQDEPVYEPTNNYEIAFAFREAGEYIGT